MKKLMILLIFLSQISVASAETVSNGLTPYGATQSGSSCWAASLAGELEATGWAMNPNPQAVYGDIVAHLGNQPGSIWHAATWYFSEYYPDVKQSDILRSGWGIDSIVQDINNAWGVSVETFPSTGIGHALQVYAYEQEAGIVEGFWAVNSWGNPSLQYMPIHDNGSWFYNSGYVGSIIGLIPFEDYVPSPDLPYIPPTEHPVIPGVPEPSVFVLVLVGMVMVVRRSHEANL